MSAPRSHLYTDTRLIVLRARRRAFFYSAAPWVSPFALIALYALVARLGG